MRDETGGMKRPDQPGITQTPPIRNRAAGKLPQPVVIGTRSVRWCVDDIHAWLAAGCPDRGTWDELRRNGRPSDDRTKRPAG